MTTPPADLDTALGFLALLYPEGPWALTAIHPTRLNQSTGRALVDGEMFDSPAEMRVWLAEHNEWNLYYHINKVRKLEYGKAKKQDVTEVWYLHVDIDSKAQTDEGRAQEWTRISKAILAPPYGMALPTGLKYSGGGGGQGLWALEEPIIIQGTTDEERIASGNNAAAYNKQIELLYGTGDADPCHNVDRILRLPGTWNWPNEKKRLKYNRHEPVMARLEFWDPTRRYPLSKFVAATAPAAPTLSFDNNAVEISGNVERIRDLDDLPEKVSDECKATIRDGVHPSAKLQEKWAGDRSRPVFYVCCELVRAGCSNDQIFAIITEPDFAISAHVIDQKGRVEEYARRQIKRARNFAIHPLLEKMNTRYAVVKNVGGEPRVIEWLDDNGEVDLAYFRPGTISFFHNNEFVKVKITKVDKGKAQEVEVDKELGDWWLKHPDRHQYERIVFEPERKIPGTYNLWQGFAVRSIAGAWDKYRDLVFRVICDSNLEYYNWLMDWMAMAVQHPARQGYISVVMKGGQGIGKGKFAQVFGALFGAHFRQLIDSDQLTGRFNSHLERIIVLYADEAFFAGDKRNISKLKGYITEDRIQIERKGVDITEVRNYLHLLIASNYDWVVPAETDDRRFFVLLVPNVFKDLPEKEKFEYFAAIDQQMFHEGGLEALLYDLKTRDLSNFNPRTCPKTQELREQKTLSFASHEEWWYSKLYEGALVDHHQGWQHPLQTSILIDDYYKHCHDRRVVRPMSRAHLGEWLKNKAVPEGTRLVRQKASGVRFYEFPKLLTCRQHWDKTFNGPYRWPDVEVEPGEPDPQPPPQGTF